jgi:hypothetical protein
MQNRTPNDAEFVGLHFPVYSLFVVHVDAKQEAGLEFYKFDALSHHLLLR